MTWGINMTTNVSHNYLDTKKSNVHTKVNGNLKQLWFGGAVPVLSSVKILLGSVVTDILNSQSEVTKKPSRKIISKILLGGFLLGASTIYADSGPVNSVTTNSSAVITFYNKNALVQLHLRQLSSTTDNV